MPSKWAWVILSLAICVTASLEHEAWKAFIHLIEFDYEDTCFSTAEAEWTFVTRPSNKTLSTWEERLVDYANFKHIQKLEVVGKSRDDSSSDSSSQYKYDAAVSVGDALLNSSDFRTLVHFAGTAEFKRVSAVFQESWRNYTRSDAERVLYFNNNAEKKKRVWAAWHRELDVLAGNVSTVLPLVEQAAEENGAKDVTQYWELLSGYEDGYEKIKYEWNKIANLHKKILQHVRNNLSHKYKVDANQSIPAYLLGSLQGSDWTPVAVDVTTHPDLMHDIKKNLWKRKLLGRSLYQTASDMGTQLLDNTPQSEFWENSNFNGQCPSKLINFCKDGAARVSTCYEPTLSNYLSAHKNIGKVLFNQMTVQNIPVLTTANRYSVLEESVGELFGIIAASSAWLNHSRIVDKSTDTEQLLMVSLMITALDVLPRLAYYMSADMWRIKANETGMKPEDLTSSWWQHRQEYEGLDNNGTEIPTFLNDDYITSNKPYLPKLTGTILAFQLYQYIMDSTEVRYESIMRRESKAELLRLVQSGGSDEWSRIVNNLFEIDEISADAMLSFFSPLEDLIDELNEDFEYKPVTVKESELHDLEKKIVAEMNAPTTTTTSAPRTVATRRKIVTTTPSSKENSLRGDGNALGDSNKSLGSKSSIHEAEEKPQNHNTSESEATSKVSLDESLDDSVDPNEDTKPKMNTSKAVWAVGAVLLATIVICVVAIFSRQRCRKTPKNRRYV
ncbi:angiotensin-converting enzyme [Lasioglossum baleicum]|uniref:angiotensin-converting enzyme n=1 Tax=Lasioglossum baleicum TaxID=434251 RepID=UPI003FCC6752